MKINEFRKHGHEVVDWMADYFTNIESFPVKSRVKPGEIFDLIEEHPPAEGEKFDDIMDDFNEKIIPGITHWQHPSFFAYFPATNSNPSVLAEMLTSALGAQCMMWVTSPAAAELEEKMMDWLKEMLRLPQEWSGVIQDTASTATLVATLTAREQKINGRVNTNGFPEGRFRIYASEQAHSSIDKAVRMAGFGSENLVKIETDEQFALIPYKLEEAIIHDKENGFVPVMVVGALGTTGSTAIDPIDEIGEIAQKYNLWYHIDAAHSGTALILEEFRDKFEKLHLADSFVFNPHKWMFTNFDCTAYYVKDKDALIETFTLTPEYLRTREESEVNNYKDWGIQLGRRFRALKLWFVIRSMGVEEIKERIRQHIELGHWFANEVAMHPQFELLAPVPLNTVCFRFNPGNMKEEELSAINDRIMHALNDSGNLYLTHTVLNGKFALRLVAGQTNVEKSHVEKAWEAIKIESVNQLSKR